MCLLVWSSLFEVYAADIFISLMTLTLLVWLIPFKKRPLSMTGPVPVVQQFRIVIERRG